MNQKAIEEFFTLMAEMLSEYGIEEFVPIEASDVIIAEIMRGETPALTFFDLLHAATCKRISMKILSSEGIYSKLGLQAEDLDWIQILGYSILAIKMPQPKRSASHSPSLHS